MSVTLLLRTLVSSTPEHMGHSDQIGLIKTNIPSALTTHHGRHGRMVLTMKTVAELSLTRKSHKCYLQFLLFLSWLNS